MTAYHPGDTVALTSTSLPGSTFDVVLRDGDTVLERRDGTVRDVLHRTDDVANIEVVEGLAIGVGSAVEVLEWRLAKLGY